MIFYAFIFFKYGCNYDLNFISIQVPSVGSRFVPAYGVASEEKKESERQRRRETEAARELMNS